MIRYCLIAGAVILSVACCGVSASGQSTDYDQKPILYSQTTATDPVAKLIRQIDAGEKALSWDKNHGWLPSLLKELSIPASSQLLVFSKTSLQIRYITPTNPRAIYFNDNVYIGAVPNARLYEIAAVDPQLGAVFYTLSTKEKTRKGALSSLKRDNTSCLSCHGTGKTQNVPGFLIRSVFAESNGQPRFELGTTTTDVSTDFIDRFGGWYITGNHGTMRHRGNLFVPSDTAELQYDQGANLASLPQRVRRGKYITDSSDIVAMMVLEHQTQMHNAVTKANYTCRKALAYQKMMNEALERNEDFVSDSTIRRLNSAADNVVKHLLFADEFQLTSAVAGSSTFAKDFQTSREGESQADSQGRDLRQFDLEKRLFKYPCSYLIYSPSFDALPTAMLDLVYERLNSVLTGKTTDGFEHLTGTDKDAISEILRDTKPGFAKFARVAK